MEGRLFLSEGNNSDTTEIKNHDGKNHKIIFLNRNRVLHSLLASPKRVLSLSITVRRIE